MKGLAEQIGVQKVVRRRGRRRQRATAGASAGPQRRREPGRNLPAPPQPFNPPALFPRDSLIARPFQCVAMLALESAIFKKAGPQLTQSTPSQVRSSVRWLHRFRRRVR